MSFTAVERAFLQRLVLSRPASRPAGAAAAFLSAQFGIGRQVANKVFYDAGHFEQAAQLLKNNDLPVAALGAGATRGDAAQFGGLSEKSGTRAPHEGELAVVLSGGCMWGDSFWASPPGTSVVCTAEDLKQLRCDVVCIVENWEAMRLLHQYQWLDRQGKAVLFVFRGDNLYSPAHVQALIAERAEPLWAFVDFDPAGLGVACGLPAARLSRVLLPSWAWLRQEADNVRGRELFERQRSQWAASLGIAESAVVREAWAELQRGRAGVTQERMLSAPGARGGLAARYSGQGLH